jgi:phosphoadenosine phosphosulfate reductase
MTFDVAAAAAALEGKSPREILSAAAKTFAPKIVFATGFGAEGCVLIDMIARANLPIDMFTLDTGLLFSETVQLWRDLEARYGVKIRAVLPEQTVPQQNTTHGDALWTRDADTCCRLRKVQPLARAVAGKDAWVSAIRRDQTPDRKNAPVLAWDARFSLVKVNPLVAWAEDDIWSYIRVNEVPYNPLHERGYPSIGCAPCTSAVAAGEDPRAGRWRGSLKNECGLHKIGGSS